MLVGQQWPDLGMVQQFDHELLEHIALLEPFPVLGEHRRNPDLIVRRQPNEPAKKKIVIELLHQLAFRTDAVEHLKQERAQELLRRDRGTSLTQIKPAKTAVQLP